MAWTESDLRADLALKYFAVDPTSTVVEVQDSKGITWMNVNVFEDGISENERVPTSYRKNISYYVFHRGLPDEEAWYSQTEPTNTSDTDISTPTATLLSYSKLYNGGLLRQRILGWILKTIMDVLAESTGVAHHSMRVKWANDALQNPSKYLNAFMCYIAMSDDVRLAGNSVSDANLLWLAYMVNNVAISFGFTD